MNVVGTGFSGLVGSRVCQLLSDSYHFTNLSLETGIDITDTQAVAQAIGKSDAPWVFHFAAYTNVQEAERMKTQGAASLVWQVNVAATETIAKICKHSGKHLLYIDTDYAFDGKQKTYTESDKTNPLSFYAQTKTEGAKKVLSLGPSGLVVRIANPYRASIEKDAGDHKKTDFVHKMIDRLKAGQTIAAPTDQSFVPTFIDDLAHAIDALVKVRASGVYHAVGGQALSPYDAALEIATKMGYDVSLVTKTTFAQYFKDRAPVPQFAALKNEKLDKLGVVMRSFHQGLSEMVLQEREQSEVNI